MNSHAPLLTHTLSIALLWGSLAYAGTIIAVEPDNFPEGTNIRTAFPGVTLSVKGDSTREVRTVDGFDLFNHRNLATTGTRVFGYFPTLPHAAHMLTA
jgi:hypothetical protein